MTFIIIKDKNIFYICVSIKDNFILYLELTILLTNKNRLLCFQNHKHGHFFWEEHWSPF